jgi:hypothetical protein
LKVPNIFNSLHILWMCIDSIFVIGQPYEPFGDEGNKCAMLIHEISYFISKSGLGYNL